MSEDQTIFEAAREKTRKEAINKLIQEEKPLVSENQKVGEERFEEIQQFRKELNCTLQRMKGESKISLQREYAVKKLQEAIMWLEMEVYPYPDFCNPESPVVEPTADGLKV